MRNPKVAARYAKSLKGLAQERNELESAKADMELIINTCKASDEFERLLMSPVINTDKKLACLNEILQGKVTELTMAFVQIITKKRRENLLGSIAEAFLILYNEFKGIHEATITTSRALTPELRKEVLAVITSAKGGDEIQLEERVDENLIGGFVLRMSDKQFDASIRHRLNNLKREFSANHYQSKI